MRERCYLMLMELKLVSKSSYLLLLLALALLALTHGVLELQATWPKHFIENMESFLPLALALLSTPLFMIDSEQGMTELNATLPHQNILTARIAGVWALGWLVFLVGAELMNIAWGPVAYWSGVLAALGPALFLTGLAIWATLITARVAVGYLVALGLPVADLILRVLGAFAAVPPLQLIDTFSYRWVTPAMPWWIPKLFLLAVGCILIASAVVKSPRYWSRSL